MGFGGIGGGLVEVDQRVVEAQRTQRAQVHAPGRLQLLRFLELLERRGRLIAPPPVDGRVLEAALLKRGLDLPDAGRSDRIRRAGKGERASRRAPVPRCRSAACRAWDR